LSSGQVGAVNGRQKAGGKSCPMTNPKIAPWQAVFRTIVESGYTINKQGRFVGVGKRHVECLSAKIIPTVVSTAKLAAFG
jgi:transposase-like protein